MGGQCRTLKTGGARNEALREVRMGNLLGNGKGTVRRWRNVEEQEGDGKHAGKYGKQKRGGGTWCKELCSMGKIFSAEGHWRLCLGLNERYIVEHLSNSY